MARWRRKALGAFAATAVTLSGLALPAQQAQANPVYELLSSSSWAYTDSRSPDRLVRDDPGDAPVGSWRDADGKHHKSRSYFTFDLSRFHGKRILSAYGILSESRVNNCEADRAVEVWLTDPVTDRSTWKEPPAERTMLDRRGPTPTTCPTPYLEFAVFEALRDAVAAGAPTMTIALRVPEEFKGDVNVGRWFTNRVRISVGHNTPPDVPTELNVYYFGCEATAPGRYVGTTQPQLRARFTDPDRGRLTGEFAIWPADQPEQRTVVTDPYVGSGSTGTVTVGEAALADGQTYAWAARATDEYDVSAWSEPCHFTIDITRPAVAPAITAPPEYPENQWAGGPGLPGTFTFSASGERDIVGYRYGWRGQPFYYVAADQLGGSATVTFNPQSSGPYTLAVVSVDRAGNRSPVARHDFMVKENRPYVTVHDYPVEPGVPVDVTFSPRMDNAVSYTYRVDAGPERTVNASSDGTATVSLTFDEAGFYTIYVRSTDATGYTTLDTRRSIYVEEPYEEDPF